MAKTVELLPVTYDPDRLQMWADENFRRIVDAIGALKTSDLTTPSVGGHVFTNGLELYQSASTPYIDFHRAVDAAGDSNADYNIRLINISNGLLQILSYAVTGVRSTIQGDTWQLSQFTGDNSYAHFGHKDWMDSASNRYAFMHKSNGTVTIVNTNGTGYLQHDANNKLIWDGAGVSIGGDFAISSNKAIYFKGAWDSVHVIHHDTGDDGFRYKTWNYHRFYVGGGTERFRVAAQNESYARLAANSVGGNQWNHMQFIAVATSGNNAGLGFSANGQACKICLNSDHGTKLVALNWDDGGYIPYKASAFEVASSKRYKRNIRPLQTERQITAKMLNPVISEPKQRNSVNPETGKFIDTSTNRKNETAFLSFIAEEVAQYAPEAVSWIVSESGNLDSEPIPDGIDVMAMVALVAQVVRNQDDRIDALERKEK